MTNRLRFFSVGACSALLLVLAQCSDPATGDVQDARGFFSSDDGKTWFADEAKNVPPFTKGGKEAVRAHVYRCPDGKQFVVWLERYTPESKKQLEAALNAKAGGPPSLPTDAPQVEVKLPGAATWVRSTDAKAAAIMTPKCAAGGEPALVTP
jgi:hypothetical protein